MNTEKHMSFLDIGSGAPILLGHSYLFDHKMWKPQIEFLSKKYRVIAPDLWGHGKSPALPAHSTSMVELARDHLRLMDSLGIDRFAVIGLSVGGMWGAELAVLAPDRVKSLMLFDTYLGSETDEKEKQYFAMLDAAYASGKIKSPLLEYITSQFYSKYAQKHDVEHLNSHLGSLTTNNLRESIVPIGKIIFGCSDRKDILSEIRCPALVATGALDMPRPPSEGELMAKLMNCRFIEIPNAGHISNREQPSTVTQIVSVFLEQNKP